MKTVGLIGAGHIGSQVARLALAHGYNVVISNSRGPESLSALVAGLGPGARAATAVDAAGANIVVVSVPLKNYRQVPVAPLAGKIVIDTNNDTLNGTAIPPARQRGDDHRRTVAGAPAHVESREGVQSRHTPPAHQHTASPPIRRTGARSSLPVMTSRVRRRPSRPCSTSSASTRWTRGR